VLHLARLAPAFFVAASLAGCTRDRPGGATRPAASGSAGPAASDSAAQAAAARRDPRRIAGVDAGMTEAQVKALLGEPDEVRTEDGHRPWIVGARAAWAYGVTMHDGFAFGGVVLFDAERKVMTTLSPVDALLVRARRLPWSDTAVVNDRGLSCHLDVLGADAGGIDARVSLRNEGGAAFERRHGHTGIAFDLVVELYDEGRRVLARYDTLSLFSPYAPDDTEVMRIPAGGSIDARVRLGAPWGELGKLPPGSYRVRVAFPFEVGRFSVSEPVPFHVGG